MIMFHSNNIPRMEHHFFFREKCRLVDIRIVDRFENETESNAMAHNNCITLRQLSSQFYTTTFSSSFFRSISSAFGYFTRVSFNCRGKRPF